MARSSSQAVLAFAVALAAGCASAPHAAPAAAPAAREVPAEDQAKLDATKAAPAEQDQVERARAMTKQIEVARARWMIDSDKDCPASIDELKQELGKHADEPVLDPWGHDYVLLCGAQAPEACDGFCAFSPGPDGQPDTADDIRSWPWTPGQK